MHISYASSAYLNINELSLKKESIHARVHKVSSRQQYGYCLGGKRSNDVRYAFEVAVYISHWNSILDRIHEKHYLLLLSEIGMLQEDF